MARPTLTAAPEGEVGAGISSVSAIVAYPTAAQLSLLDGGATSTAGWRQWKVSADPGRDDPENPGRKSIIGYPGKDRNSGKCTE